MKANTQSVKGNLKNGVKASKLAPTLSLKLFAFLGVGVVPILFMVVIVFFSVMILVAMAGVIIVNDPEIGFNPVTGEMASNGSSGNNRAIDSTVPDAVKGKLLLSWNADFVTRGQAVGHRGIDLQPINKTVYADDLALYPVYPGTVYKVQKYKYSKMSQCSKLDPNITMDCSYGNALIIKIELSGKTYYTLYGHLDKLYVDVGDEVGWYTQVGKMGCTGNSFGSWHGCGTHLHLEILNDTVAKVGINKSALLPNMQSYFACGVKTLTVGYGVANKHCTDYRTSTLGKDQFGKP